MIKEKELQDFINWLDKKKDIVLAQRRAERDPSEDDPDYDIEYELTSEIIQEYLTRGKKA
jgi:hypothetical protein